MGVPSRRLGAWIGTVALVVPAIVGAEEAPHCHTVPAAEAADATTPGSPATAGAEKTPHRHAAAAAAAAESPSKNHLDGLEAAEPEGRSQTKRPPFARSARPSVGPAPGRDDGGTGLATRVTIAEAPLVDQAGKPVRLAEVAGDRIVVANFIFTSCTTVCPVLSGLFTSLQDRLGDKLGSRVQLVSISIDPVHDTPAKLAEMAKRHHSGPAWRWLTGERENVEQVLRGLGTYVPVPASHAPVVLVGDPKNGKWYRINGFPSPESLAGRIDQLLAARTAGAERTR